MSTRRGLTLIEGLAAATILALVAVAVVPGLGRARRTMVTEQRILAARVLLYDLGPVELAGLVLGERSLSLAGKPVHVRAVPVTVWADDQALAPPGRWWRMQVIDGDNRIWAQRLWSMPEAWQP